MRSGSLRRLAEIFRLDESGGRDALNHPLPGQWVEVAIVRCMIAYEYKPAERRDAKASTEVLISSAWITIRYREGLTRQMRVVTDGSTWNIVDIQADEKHRYMRLFCEKVSE